MGQTSRTKVQVSRPWAIGRLWSADFPRLRLCHHRWDLKKISPQKYMFHICSICVPYMFHIYSIYVPYMFHIYYVYLYVFFLKIPKNGWWSLKNPKHHMFPNGVPPWHVSPRSPPHRRWRGEVRPGRDWWMCLTSKKLGDLIGFTWDSHGIYMDFYGIYMDFYGIYGIYNGN